MAIRKRNTNQNNINQDRSDGISGFLNNDQENIKKPKFSDIELKTFRDEVFEVLDILESTGVDIYDENNYPGMYLKTKSNKDNLVKSIFSKKQKNKKHDNTLQEESFDSNNSETKLDNLFDFFKKSK